MSLHGEPLGAQDADAHGAEDPRRAALALHALARRDQRWVMDRLAPAQRRQMSGLLGELRALRIPADVALLKSLRAPVPRADTQAPAQATPEVIAGWLAREQPFVVAACLLDLARGLQDDVLARLAPSQAAAARALMAGGLEHAHALRQAVRTSLQARRAQAGAVPVQAGGWRARLKSLWSRA
jgi:hypothetical protein